MGLTLVHWLNYMAKKANVASPVVNACKLSILLYFAFLNLDVYTHLHVHVYFCIQVIHSFPLT